jgi:hypothetical protein
MTTTTTATLTYSATAVAPVTANALEAAMAAVELDFEAIEQKTGCTKRSDTITKGEGADAITSTRTIVFNLPYTTVLQFNGGNALPSNSKIKRWYVVTTTGAHATIGQLLYDNGTNTGTVAVIGPITGMQIVTAANNPNAYQGGAITFINQHLYNWDGTTWDDLGPTLIGKSAFQSNFPAVSGSQAAPFNNLYTHALGAGLGSVITAQPVVIA